MREGTALEEMLTMLSTHSMDVRSQGGVQGSAESLLQEQGDYKVSTEIADFREKLN